MLEIVWERSSEENSRTSEMLRTVEREREREREKITY